MMTRLPLCGLPRTLGVLCLLLSAAWIPAFSQAQDNTFDSGWYGPSDAYVKIGVTEDGIYRMAGSDLAALDIPLSSINPGTLRLLRHGEEVPLHYVGDENRLTADGQIYFIGLRNTGKEETWAYRNNPEWQSSTYFSLYTDTTFYWLTWGGAQGKRYRLTQPNLNNTGEDIFTFQDTLHVEADNNYYDGDGDTEAENPFYTHSEGYYMNGLGHSSGDPSPDSNTYTGGRLSDMITNTGNLELRVKLKGRSASRHRIQLGVDSRIDGERKIRIFDEADWVGYDFNMLRTTIPQIQIPDRGTRVIVELTSFNEFNGNPNSTFVDWIEFSYLRSLNARGGKLRFGFANPGSRRMTIDGFNTETVLVFSTIDNKVYNLTPTNKKVAFFHFAPTAPVYWASDSSAVLSPVQIKLDASSNLASSSNQADYLILTTPFLRPSAEALADYRRAQNGYKVQVIDIQDVYDQFDYGRPTPIAIRRFVHQTQQWDKSPRFLMLWGDTVYPERETPRTAWDVPSYGKASSDGWYAMQANGPDDWTEFLAIGRLPIRDNEAGLLFLQKLETYESASLEDWQKRMLMLVGGRTPSEQLSLQSLVLPWSNRGVAAPTGMDSLHFFSNTDNPFGIEGAFQDSLRIALRKGASWLTYFGHSAAQTWEIVTDEPADFDNATRLPLAISLGCRTGAFGGGAFVVDDTPVLAEKLVVGTLNGSIAHWGSSGLGSVSASARMGSYLHEVVFTDTLRTIGEVFREVKRRYADPFPSSLRDHVQFGLIGDPATRLGIPTQPDFKVAQEQIRVSPLTPIPADSVVTVSVQLKNLGLVPQDSLSVQLLHTPPSASPIAYTQRVAPFRLSTEISFTVPITEDFVGDNGFQVQVDPDNIYDEVIETNNVAARTHVIFSSEVTLVAPRNLGTLSTDATRFRVSYTGQDPTTTKVVFQLDTVPTFDSPSLAVFETPASGSFAVWNLEEPLEPATAYYWRAGLKTPGEPINWREAAFTVRESNEQHSWYQAGTLFSLNTLSPSLKRENDLWQFTPYQVDVQFTSERGSGQFKGRFLVNGVEFEAIGLGYGILILDGTSGAYKASGSMPIYDNRFEDPAIARARLDSLVHVMEQGDYVYVRTRHLGIRTPSDIPDDVRDIFRSLGSTAIDTLTYGNLWLMRTRFGLPEETQEWVPSGTNEAVQEETLSFINPEGQIHSPEIGPARKWQSFDWHIELPNSGSEVVVDVLSASSEDILLGDLTSGGPLDLSSIDAMEHPYLRLRTTLRDTTQQATPQLLDWSVDYTSIPELVVDPSSLVLSADTLNESEPLTLTAQILNLSDTPADTVVVTLDLTDANNNTTLAAADTLINVLPDATTEVSFELATQGLIGTNQLTLKAEQPNLSELLTFNNTAITQFRVLGDRLPPVLRVTVDGTEYPADPDPIRDLQSPDIPQLPVRPTIEVVFADENPFRLLTDTTLAKITLNGQPIPFNSPDVQFEPATESKNEARIMYTPDFTGQDAVHTLVVTAFDVNGNEAEGSPYQFHFRVASMFEVGSIYPYPNPMSRFTRFAFLVKGANTSLIDDFRIRIYTLSGRVVQEFDLIEDAAKLDGGQVRVGWNKLLWDGKDADGDLLAPGVYLYKVYLQVEGQQIAINNDSGIEKLVIIR